MFTRECLFFISKVLQIFEEVQRRHTQGQSNPGFEYDLDLPDTERNFVLEEDNTMWKRMEECGRGSGSSTPSTVSAEESPVL